MKKIKLVVLSVFSLAGLFSLSSCSKESAPPVARFPEGTVMYCVTSTDDMVPCDQLEEYEKNVLMYGAPRTGIRYERLNCTVYDLFGFPGQGTECRNSRNGTCGDYHLCEPCANC